MDSNLFTIAEVISPQNRDKALQLRDKIPSFFPKKFVPESSFDDDGYSVYRKRDYGRVINKFGVSLDNRYVVPHNMYLLLRYKAHINVECCNQSRFIKYLFKYINKGHDRVTIEFCNSTATDAGAPQLDEIKMYYGYRYISASEAAWCLFGFEIQFRQPFVERLSFHLPNQQSIVFQDDEATKEIMNRPTINQSMFLAWFEANKKYSEARLLTYAEMPTKFVWKKSLKEWHLRQRGNAIGRIFYVPPTSGEIYYLRILLNFVSGARSFDDIKTVDGVTHGIFRDACYARGLLDDDKEYIDTINEAHEWASAKELRKLLYLSRS